MHQNDEPTTPPSINNQAMMDANQITANIKIEGDQQNQQNRRQNQYLQSHQDHHYNEDIGQSRSQLETGNEAQSPSTDDNGPDDRMLRDQDRFLPIAIISRIMKTSIPNSGKIAKDAKECIQESVSEFVSFITSEASERCQLEKRKTMTGDDIIYAMSNLGFDNYIEPLMLYLKKYRQVSKGVSDKMTSSHSMCSDTLDEGSL